MGIFTTGFGPVFINCATIVGHQEGAGGLVENIIILLVQVHVLPNYLRWFEPQGFCQPLHILVRNHWTDAAAAIGTSQAVESSESLLVKGLDHFIQIFGWLFLQLLEKALILCPGIQGQFLNIVLGRS
jgi:hypothetical protein